MNFNKLFFSVLEEQNVLKTTKTKPIVDAIKNRYPITFYYSGPRKPKKDSVKAGYRVKAESVALGLSKKGNLILRAWVQPPSTSKKGFSQHGWRTFILSRMNNVEVFTNETFDSKRPQYKEGDDNSMSVTYVTADWTKTPKTKPVEKPTPIQSKPTKVQPVTKSTEPTPIEPKKPEEKPQPKPEEKPIQQPQDTDNQDYEVKRKELYKTKQTDFINKQKEIGGNIKPGQGTRERFKKEVEKELPQPEVEKKPTTNPEDELLNESIRKIKRLMFS
jgi:hypothetical protein